MYFRRTNSENPMSDWGHAMFAENIERINGAYGENLFKYDGKDAVKIEDLKEKVIEAWEDCQENGFSCPNDDYFENLDAETIFNMLNPEDIVMSAEGWDESFMVSWFWTYIAEPNNIMAVLTQDGAIVFDEELIEK